MSWVNGTSAPKTVNRVKSECDLTRLGQRDIARKDVQYLRTLISQLEGARVAYTIESAPGQPFLVQWFPS